MIRTKPTTGLIEQKPRKMLKLDLINRKQYNEFEGNSQIDEEQNKRHSQTHHHDSHSRGEKMKQEKPEDIGKQITDNQNIFNMISQDHLKFRKTNDFIKPKNAQLPQQSSDKNLKKQNQSSDKNLKKETTTIPPVKLEEGTQPTALKTDQPKTAKKQVQNPPKQKPKAPQPSSNWKLFLENSKPANNSNTKSQNNTGVSSGKDAKTTTANESSKFVAMDCEFVKCEQTDALARISIVSQSGQTLYDSYIKPENKITNFLTEITGITYSHVKQAPKWSQEVAKVKKILLGKMVVGHTIDKDLEVTKLTDWKGISQKINIAEFSQYKEKGGSKVVSLKRMALSFLNRNIQSGWHSSVEDSVATMDLFKLNKKKILKQFKLI